VSRSAFSAVILLFAVCAESALAHEPTANCSGIADDSARLTCYDTSSGRRGAAVPTPISPTSPGAAAATVAVPATAAPAMAATTAAAVAPTTVAAAVPAPATAAASLSSSPTATFGLDREQRDEIDELSGTVVSVANQSHYGRWVVTLDNGQVWEQRETTPASRRPRPGDVATIKKASLGSYLLSAPNRGSNRVRRVQ
jgi:hypothetical protein